MGVTREVTMEFGGENYTFVPSNKLLRRIDAELAPQTLFGVLALMDGVQAPLPALAYIISELLNAGGGNFTEDDILQELYVDVRENQGNGIKPLMEAIVHALSMPGASEQPGNSPARVNPGSKVKGKKGARSSRG